MPIDQAIFTSLPRRGKSGYHLVSRSAGITASEASAIASWSPSHGGLIVDEANQESVNYFPLPSGRYGLARTREGRPEYSGRGGRQLYTHIILFDVGRLQHSRFRPFEIYRDALALGHFHYQPNPKPVLDQIELSTLYADRNDSLGLAKELNAHALASIVAQLDAGQPVTVPYHGDRTAMAEALIRLLSPESIMRLSFATNLTPSAVRPFHLSMVSDAR